MWARAGALRPNTVELLRQSILSGKWVQAENRSVNADGATFFRGVRNLVHLQNVVRDIHPAFKDYYGAPCLLHSFLLVKSAIGSRTPPHQDITFWKEYEVKAPSKLVTLWIALEEIDADHGCLRLPAHGERATLESFNSESTIFEYSAVKEANGVGYVHEISGKQREEIERDFIDVPVKTGDVIAFDAYTPHASSENKTGRPRLAMKIVVGEISYLTDPQKHLSIDEVLGMNRASLAARQLQRKIGSVFRRAFASK